ncbi:4648_t:CDS:2, partial [Gigaspora rosea]
ELLRRVGSGVINTNNMKAQIFLNRLKLEIVDPLSVYSGVQEV